MKLNQEQIQELYRFTRAHYVEHFDVQTELVDHLANGIEEQWQDHPNRSFQEALNSEFKKFGVFGFQDVVAARKKAMSSRYRALLWRFFKEWFRLPKLLFTLSAMLVLFVAVQFLSLWEYKGQVVSGILLLFCALIFTHVFRTRRARKKKIGVTGKTFMLEGMIFDFGEIFAFIYLPVNLFVSFERSLTEAYYSTTFDMVFSVVFTSLLLVAYIAFFVLPSQAEELLQETYPEYKMA